MIQIDLSCPPSTFRTFIRALPTARKEAVFERTREIEMKAEQRAEAHVADLEFTEADAAGWAWGG